MSNLAYFIFAHDEARRRAALFCDKAPSGTIAIFKEATRNLDQNACLWATLTDIAEQVEWPVDGAMQKLPPEDWKAILSAGVIKGQRVAQGIEGGFVMLGQRTSKMSVKQMSSLIEFSKFFGDSKGVVWSDPKAPRAAA